MGLLYGTRRALLSVRDQSLSDISGLYFEMDATKPASLYSDSAFTTLAVPAGPVGGVVDVSGANLDITGTQITTTAKPTYTLNAINARSALSFDGGDWLACDALAPYVSGSDKPFTLAAVVKFTSTAALRALFSFGRAATNDTYRYFGITWVGPAWYFESNDDVDSKNTDTDGTPDTNSHVLCWLFSGTTISLLIDGMTIMNELAHNVGVCTLDQSTIGGARWFGFLTQFFLGYIGDLAVWPTRRISNAEASFVTRTLGQKWGIATS